MPSPSILDVNRTPAVAEKKRWIAKAVPKSHEGVFRKKAEAAGETTKEFAKDKAGAGGKIGKEARLAETLMGMSKKRGMFTNKKG